MNDQPKTVPSPYDAAIADARAKRDYWDNAVKVLESLRDGASVGGLTGPLTAPFTSAPIYPVNDTHPAAEIPHGTFHRMSIEVAVKKLLEMRKRTMGVQEIVADLSAGGLRLQTGTPTNTVTSVLTRAFNAGSEIVRVSRGTWGLQEWFPTQRFKRGGED